MSTSIKCYNEVKVAQEETQADCRSGYMWWLQKVYEKSRGPNDPV